MRNGINVSILPLRVTSVSRTAAHACLDKSRIVEEGNWHKFTNAKESSEMQKLLLATGERELVEVRLTDMLENLSFADEQKSSPFDRIWGVGFDAANAEANWDSWGENLLGKALMNVRARIRKGEAM